MLSGKEIKNESALSLKDKEAITNNGNVYSINKDFLLDVDSHMGQVADKFRLISRRTGEYLDQKVFENVTFRDKFNVGLLYYYGTQLIDWQIDRRWRGINEIRQVTGSPIKDEFFLGDMHGIQHWKISNNKMEFITRIKHENLTCMAITGDGKMLITRSGHWSIPDNDRLTFWSIDDKSNVKCIVSTSLPRREKHDTPHSILITPDTQFLICINHKGNLRGDHSSVELYNISDIHHPSLLCAEISPNHFGSSHCLLSNYQIASDKGVIMDFPELREAIAGLPSVLKNENKYSLFWVSQLNKSPHAAQEMTSIDSELSPPHKRLRKN